MTETSAIKVKVYKKVSNHVNANKVMPSSGALSTPVKVATKLAALAVVVVTTTAEEVESDQGEACGCPSLICDTSQAEADRVVVTRSNAATGVGDVIAVTVVTGTVTI